MRKTLLKGNLEVCSELSFLESDEDEKHNSKFPPPFNQTMKAAFQTVTDYNSGDKAKEMFGFRRNTFQNTNSVLSETKTPLLGVDRKLNDTPSSRIPNNKDISGDDDDDSGFARLQTEKLPLIKFPMQTIPELNLPG